jgi:hypothetical protein
MQFVKRSCQECDKSFQVKAFLIKHGRGKYCSKSCRIKAQSKAISGKSHYNWRGGKILHQGKYWLIYKKEHPFADRYGYVREHRLVVEAHLGRYLRRDEIIHHKNGVTTDNRLDNLKILNLSTHTVIHKLGKKFPKEVTEKISASMKRVRACKKWGPSEESKKRVSKFMKNYRKKRFWSSNPI